MTIYRYSMCFKSVLADIQYHHIPRYNKEVFVSSLVGWLPFTVEEFWALWNNIYECVCCYNRCHGNAVKEAWASCDNIYDCVCLLL
jgi:hypothetical protein